MQQGMKTIIIGAVVGALATVGVIVAGLVYWFVSEVSGPPVELNKWRGVAAEARNARAVASLPAGPLVYQPMFVWARGEPTYQGTGFLAHSPTNEVVGVTSAHFINFDGPTLIEAQWLEIPSYDSVLSFTHSLGRPGRAGRGTDHRTDYLILTGVRELELSKRPILELDPRAHPDIGERVWLPNKNDVAPDGYVQVEGTVVETSETYATILFDEYFELQSQSGSPLISQQTGKVIGTLASGGEQSGHVYVLTAPSASILAAMSGAGERYELRVVVGK